MKGKISSPFLSEGFTSPKHRLYFPGIGQSFWSKNFVSGQQIQKIFIPTCNATALKVCTPLLAKETAYYLHQYTILSRNYRKTCTDQTVIQFYPSAQENSSPAVVQQKKLRKNLEKTLHNIYLLCMVEN